MYQGKHLNKNKRRRRRNRQKATMLLTSLALLLTLLIGGTVAFMIATDDSAKNEFRDSTVTCEVNETFSGGVKSDVTIENTGKKFHRLTALYIVKRNEPKDGVIWHCRCNCGNEVDISYNNLVFGNQKSCGCQKKEHDKKLGSFLTHVAGTSVDMLKSKKVPTDNTTGYKGVYLIKGKYVAKIVFQKKAYYLGTYDDIADAVQARKEAEEVLFDGVAEHYAKWKEKADTDPSWAKENPIQVFVSQKSDKRLSLALLPILNAETY